jgi:hypothetical protein
VFLAPSIVQIFHTWGAHRAARVLLAQEIGFEPPDFVGLIADQRRRDFIKGNASWFVLVLVMVRSVSRVRFVGLVSVVRMLVTRSGRVIVAASFDGMTCRSVGA